MEHIKITCEYCGTAFYPEKHIVCPHCGASYVDNRQIKEKQKEQEERERAQKERQAQQREENKLRLEEMRSKNEYAQRNRERADKLNKGCTGVVFGIGMFVIFCVLIGVILGVNGIKDEIDTERVSTTTTEPTTEVEVVRAEGRFGEEVDTGRYTFKIDKIVKTDAYPWTASANHTCVLIHALITNKMSYHSLDAGDVYDHLIADGIAQRSFILPTGYSGFASYIPKGLTAEGWFKFEIPDNAKEMEFQFGDYVSVYFTWDNVTTE